MDALVWGFTWVFCGLVVIALLLLPTLKIVKTSGVLRREVTGWTVFWLLIQGAVWPATIIVWVFGIIPGYLVYRVVRRLNK